MEWIGVEDEFKPQDGQRVVIFAFKYTFDGTAIPFTGIARYNPRADYGWEWECIDTTLGTCWNGVTHWIPQPPTEEK